MAQAQSDPTPPSSVSPPSPWILGCPKCALDLLLEDDTGTELFEAYLKQEECDQLLDFYFAVRGLKSSETQEGDMSKMIRVIYNHFLADPNRILYIRDETRAEINKKMSSGSPLVRNIFNQAQEEVFDYMNEFLYPNFMKESGIYLANPSDCKGEPTEKLTQSLLETVREAVGEVGIKESDPPPNLELAPSSSGKEHSSKGLPSNLKLSKEALKTTQSLRSKSIEGKLNKSKRGPTHPYHTAYISYQPVTMQSSEVQSMNSEDMSRERERRIKMKSSGPVTVAIAKTLEPSGHPNPQPKKLEVSEFAALLTEKLLIAQRGLAAERERKRVDQLKFLQFQEDPQRQRLFDALNERFLTSEEPNEILDKHVNRIWSDKTPPSKSKSPTNRGFSSKRVPHHNSIGRREIKEITPHCSRDTGIEQDFGPKLPIRTQQGSEQGTCKPLKKNKSLEWDSGISTLSTAKSVPKSIPPKLDDRVHHWI